MFETSIFIGSDLFIEPYRDITYVKGKVNFTHVHKDYSEARNEWHTIAHIIKEIQTTLRYLTFLTFVQVRMWKFQA